MSSRVDGALRADDLPLAISETLELPAITICFAAAFELLATRACRDSSAHNEDRQAPYQAAEAVDDNLHWDQE